MPAVHLCHDPFDANKPSTQKPPVVQSLSALLLLKRNLSCQSNLIANVRSMFYIWAWWNVEDARTPRPDFKTWRNQALKMLSSLLVSGKHCFCISLVYKFLQVVEAFKLRSAPHTFASKLVQSKQSNNGDVSPKILQKHVENPSS